MTQVAHSDSWIPLHLSTERILTDSRILGIHSLIIAVGNVISEPATGIQFPDSIIAPGSTSTQTLLGAGAPYVMPMPPLTIIPTN